MRDERRTSRLAWLILILSFLACITAAVGTPLGIKWYIAHATRPLEVQLQPRAGVVTFQTGRSSALTLINESREVHPQSRIVLSSDDAEALLLFYLPHRTDKPVSTLQLYGETDVVFISARTPRFPSSELPHRIVLQVNAGHEMRISVGGDERASQLHIQTPQGSFDLAEGSYTLAVDAERTELSVNKGQARIPTGENEILVLTDFQRTELTAEGVGEIVSGGQRDLLRNSDFDQPLGSYWHPYTRAKERGDQSDGRVERITGERNFVLFERNGIGHIETGITQEVNQNVLGIRSLHVNAVVRVDAQSIPFCGESGTECPVMIRITYLDAQGGMHEWLQGFYTLEGGGYSNVCNVCEGSPRHIQVPTGAWYPYTSPDLIPELNRRGIQPATILRVDVYASGHSFRAAVDEVSLLIEE